jgi:hypothetical protein
VETWVGERAEFELVATWDREKMFKVASVDKAMEMGINWWQSDSYLTSRPKEAELEMENKMLKERLDRIEEKIKVE